MCPSGLILKKDEKSETKKQQKSNSEEKSQLIKNN
ncbi:hypothetical protein D623_10028724 [Myotis brandtii]|uniref:Uncharacterized protein n=1 Tax=Myotis brandtii TaxID=109478 RepID=S7PU77_MYOBR|nr:hypothetical protein D623_10028724 [Myotis brandtii]